VVRLTQLSELTASTNLVIVFALVAERETQTVNQSKETSWGHIEQPKKALFSI